MRAVLCGDCRCQCRCRGRGRGTCAAVDRAAGFSPAPAGGAAACQPRVSPASSFSAARAEAGRQQAPAASAGGGAGGAAHPGRGRRWRGSAPPAPWRRTGAPACGAWTAGAPPLAPPPLPSPPPPSPPGPQARSDSPEGATALSLQRSGTAGLLALRLHQWSCFGIAAGYDVISMFHVLVWYGLNVIWI